MVRGLIDAITIKTETIAAAMNRKTPVAVKPVRCRLVDVATRLVSADFEHMADLAYALDPLQ